MASSKYRAIVTEDDEDGDSVPLQPMNNNAGAISHEDLSHENDSSQPLSPYQHGLDQPILVTPTSSQHESVNTLTENHTEEDVPFSRLRANPSLDTINTAYDSQHQIYLGTEDERRLSSSSRIKYSLSPSTHHLRLPGSHVVSTQRGPDGTSETARVYGFWRQTRRLWRLAATEWLITGVLCASFAGILVSYSNKDSLNSRQVYIFNVVTTILTFLLGVNLAGSMKSYAKMLRWLLLSTCWQPLETFDLIVGCDSILNVCKLALRSFKHKSLRLKIGSLVIAGLWLLAVLSLTLAVGMIGLSYSQVPSDQYRELRNGTVQITDFTQLRTDDIGADAYYIQQAGLQGLSLSCETRGDFSGDNVECATDRYGDGYYRLQAWNPNDLSISMNSSYIVIATAECKEWEIVSGGDGTQQYIYVKINPKDNVTWVNIARNNQSLPYPGGIVAISALNETWRYRATNVGLFVPRNATGAVKGQFFSCETSLTPVMHIDSAANVSTAPDEYQFDNRTAYLLSGAIGYNGDVGILSGYGAIHQYNTYKNFSALALSIPQDYGKGRLSVQNASDFIVSYTIRSISALDTRGSGLNKFREAPGQIPLRAQTLNVEWKWAIVLLAGIPTVQLIACVAVFAVANRAIIKDDSPLSIARLYWSILDKYGLGTRGGMLKGTEIVRYIGSKTGDPMGPMVTYGWKPTDNRDGQYRRMGNLDVFELSDEGKEVVSRDTFTSVDMSKVRNKFWSGIQYDGLSRDADLKEREQMRQRRPQTVVEEGSEMYD